MRENKVIKMKKFILQGVLISSVLGFTGCNETNTQQNTEIVETTEQSDTVSFKEVNPPKYGEDFATLDDKPVYWGVGEKLVMTENSGYPGFGYPLIVINFEDEFKNTINLTTSWGNWEYQLVDVKEGYLGTALEIHSFNDMLSNTKIEGNFLYLLAKGNCGIYELVRGTMVE